MHDRKKKSSPPDIEMDYDGIYAICHFCKRRLWKMFGAEFVVNPDEMPRFCPKCGKKVKWE